MYNDDYSSITATYIFFDFFHLLSLTVFICLLNFTFFFSFFLVLSQLYYQTIKYYFSKFNLKLQKKKFKRKNADCNKNSKKI